MTHSKTSHFLQFSHKPEKVRSHHKLSSYCQLVSLSDKILGKSDHPLPYEVLEDGTLSSALAADDCDLRQIQTERNSERGEGIL